MNGLHAAQALMRKNGVPEQAIDVFSSFYRQLEHGATGMIAEADVLPLEGIDRAPDLEYSLAEQRAAAQSTAVIKLNGGLGTTMGLAGAKSLLPISSDGLTFLDIIVQQVRYVREKFDVELPLLLMNSFRTHDETIEALSVYPDLAVPGLPLDFLQNQEPKLDVQTLEPISWPADRELEWCPPGHADLYTAISTSGVLDQLLGAGYKYATISNADNLGAAPSPQMMAWFAESGAPYAAEVCRRTAADVKGGHLVVRKSDGRLMLRETAQVRPEDADLAADRSVHRFFHTNNLWIDLRALKGKLESSGGVLGLPLIRNLKNVDPADPSSPEVIQIESAMGAAVEIFEGATAIEVTRRRFLPVKTTDDLLLLRSDVYRLNEERRLELQTEEAPLIRLDSQFYGTVDAFDDRIVQVPSLVEATGLAVEGDWLFAEPTTVRGDAVLRNEGPGQCVVPAPVVEGD